MTVSDYIVEFLHEKGIEHVFGYPGGMVTYLMDSFSRRKDVVAHVSYHEQAAAFSACGYAQSSGKMGVAYATSGPGATNMITGICNAYFDSIPVLFITGQVNSYEMKDNLGIRQKGFQETDIISMVTQCTKYCECVAKKENVRYCLEKAYHMANEGRPGPVLLDIPMDVLKAEIAWDELEAYECYEANNTILKHQFDIEEFKEYLADAKRPCVLIGAGVKTSGQQKEVRNLLDGWTVPVVSSMISCDVMGDSYNYYGYIGAYGDRTANFIVAKCDLLIVLGSRLDVRQVGINRDKFASEAQIVRIDIDRNEIEYPIHPTDIGYVCDIREFVKSVQDVKGLMSCNNEWKCVCNEIRNKLKNIDERNVNRLIRKFSAKGYENTVITTDVGQNQVWIAQSYEFKQNQKVLFSGGHGAMGYSLPAAIGAYYGSGMPVISFNGDGGFQMNLQECQFINREKLPILIVIINNYSLGMIRHFQEMYFDSNYFQTVEAGGYLPPDFEKIANAFNLQYQCICDEDDVELFSWDMKTPTILEIVLKEDTYVFPKLEFGKENQDQVPLLQRELYSYLMEL